MSKTIQDVENTKNIFYRVKNGETLEDVCKKFKIAKGELGLNEIEDGDVVYIKHSNIAFHIVKPLETLKQIAEKYSVSVEHIKIKNNITEIFIGQKLVILKYKK